MDEIASLRARGVFASRPPAYLADARQDISDRLLLSMMVNAGACSRLDLEQPAPQRRLNAELRGDRRQANGPWRLRRSRVECSRTDDAN